MGGLGPCRGLDRTLLHTLPLSPALGRAALPRCGRPHRCAIFQRGPHRQCGGLGLDGLARLETGRAARIVPDPLGASVLRPALHDCGGLHDLLAGPAASDRLGPHARLGAGARPGPRSASRGASGAGRSGETVARVSGRALRDGAALARACRLYRRRGAARRAVRRARRMAAPCRASRKTGPDRGAHACLAHPRFAGTGAVPASRNPSRNGKLGHRPPPHADGAGLDRLDRASGALRGRCRDPCLDPRPAAAPASLDALLPPAPRHPRNQPAGLDALHGAAARTPPRAFRDTRAAPGHARTPRRRRRLFHAALSPARPAGLRRFCAGGSELRRCHGAFFSRGLRKEPISSPS